MSVCIAAFFPGDKISSRLSFFSFASAQPFCLLPTSPCLPVFQGKRSPQLPSTPSLVCRVGASSARPLNEFHMALQAAASAQDTQTPTPQKSHTHTVQRFKGHSQQTSRMQLFESGVSLSQNTQPLPAYLLGCCVLNRVQSLGAGCILMLSD